MSRALDELLDLAHLQAGRRLALRRQSTDLKRGPRNSLLPDPTGE
jgi:hypothetical protein